MMPPFDTALLRHPAMRHRHTHAGARFILPDEVRNVTRRWRFPLWLSKLRQPV